MNTFIQFKKPIVVAVNGPAVGLGASILPLCDVIWANEKAWFQTPYATIGQTPDACSSITFPRIMGVASVSWHFQPSIPNLLLLHCNNNLPIPQASVQFRVCCVHYTAEKAAVGTGYFVLIQCSFDVVRSMISDDTITLQVKLFTYHVLLSNISTLLFSQKSYITLASY